MKELHQSHPVSESHPQNLTTSGEETPVETGQNTGFVAESHSHPQNITASGEETRQQSGFVAESQPQPQYMAASGEDTSEEATHGTTSYNRQIEANEASSEHNSDSEDFPLGSWSDETASDPSFGYPLSDPPLPQITLTPPDHEVGLSAPPADPQRLHPAYLLPFVEMRSASSGARGPDPHLLFAPEPARTGGAWGRLLDHGPLSIEPGMRVSGLTSEDDEVECAHIEDVEDFTPDS